MRIDLFDTLFLGTGALAYSAPFSLNGANTVVVQLINVIGTMTTATIEGSDDLENWHSSVSLTVSATEPDVTLSTIIGLDTAYCRLTLTAAANGIFNACLNTSTL